jgi:23S rRNA (cytidine1920-2'-O)/16S rRNA (cytidine1409-2'-O)-methyltransferase
VTVLDRTNARALARDQLPFAPDLIVIDVSFISVRKVLPAVIGSAAGSFDCLAMVKPQFEVGRDRVGKGGVVRSAEDRRAALEEVGRFGTEAGLTFLGFASSGLPGPAGNRETFAWLAEAGRPGGVDPEPAALAVEP